MNSAPHRPSVRLHNSSVTHAGRVAGTYDVTGNTRYATRCGAERGGPSYPFLASGPVTCKRCLAKLAALDAAAEATTAREAAREGRQDEAIASALASAHHADRAHALEADADAEAAPAVGHLAVDRAYTPSATVTVTTPGGQLVAYPGTFTGTSALAQARAYAMRWTSRRGRGMYLATIRDGSGEVRGRYGARRIAEEARRLATAFPATVLFDARLAVRALAWVYATPARREVAQPPAGTRPAGLLSLRQRLEAMDTPSLRDYVAALEADDRDVEADLRAEARGELTRRQRQGEAFTSLQAADTRRRLAETRLELAARRAAITRMGAELESLERRRAKLAEAMREEGEAVAELMREERRLAPPGSSLAGPRQRARLERLAGA